MAEEEIGKLSDGVLAAIDSLAMYYDASVAALSLLTILVVWTSRVSGHHRALWGLLVAVIIGQAGGFAADAVIDNRTLGVNIVLSALPLVGIIPSGVAVHCRSSQQERLIAPTYGMNRI